MFNGNYLEANSVLVPVYGVSKDTFLSFLEYLYTDSCCPGKKILKYTYFCYSFFCSGALIGSKVAAFMSLKNAILVNVECLKKENLFMLCNKEINHSYSSKFNCRQNKYH